MQDRTIASWMPGNVSSRAVFWVLATLLGLAIIVQAARLIWTVVAPVGALGDWTAAQPAAQSAQARRALFTTIDPFYRNDSRTAASQGPVNITSLDLTLFGIRLDEVAESGSAILAGEDGVQKNIIVGEEVQPGVTLAAVAFDHVILSRGATRERLYLDQSKDVPVTSPSQRPAVTGAPADAGNNADGRLARAGRALTGEDLTSEAMASGISFTARREDGQVTGLAIKPSDDGAIFRRFGFRDGDVITAYDGRDVTSADDIQRLVSKVKPGARFSVSVERGANILPIAIIVPEQ